MTISPLLSVTIEFSNASSKLISFSCLFNSSIFPITSLIVRSGVDAPAVIPSVFISFIFIGGKSPYVSIKKVFLQYFFASSYSFCVFELFLLPITSMTSESRAICSASSCLVPVALHIVSNFITFLHLSFNLSYILLNLCTVKVVCETRQQSPSISGKLSTSSGVFAISAVFAHHPFTPMTSGWFLSPAITIVRPSLCFCSTSLCIFFT